MIVALPPALVPAVEIPLILWARHASISSNPDYLHKPPTISRAISDPEIGGIFADLNLVIAVLVCISMPMILWAYLRAMDQLLTRRPSRFILWAILAFFCLGQITASLGMVLATQYTFSNGHDLHMLGSYIFFPTQALALVAAAILCRILFLQKQKYGFSAEAWPFRSGMHLFRYRFSFLIIFFAVCFGVLYVIKGWNLPISAYAVRVLYTQSEVLVISSYVLFFGSYSLDILKMMNQKNTTAPAGTVS